MFISSFASDVLLNPLLLHSSSSFPLISPLVFPWVRPFPSVPWLVMAITGSNFRDRGSIIKGYAPCSTAAVSLTEPDHPPHTKVSSTCSVKASESPSEDLNTSMFWSWICNSAVTEVTRLCLTPETKRPLSFFQISTSCHQCSVPQCN